MAIGTQSSISMHSGDTRVLEITVVDENQAAVDLSAADVTWALSKKAADEVLPKGSALLTKVVGNGIAIVDAVTGRADVTIDPSDTEALAGDFYHELQVVLGGAVSTVLYGTVTIVKDLIQ